MQYSSAFFVPHTHIWRHQPFKFAYHIPMYTLCTPPLPSLLLNVYMDRHILSICLKHFLHISCHSSYPNHSYSSPMAPRLNYCVVHFPVTRGLVTGLLISFHADRWICLWSPHQNPPLYGLIVTAPGIGFHQETTLHANILHPGHGW